jgi:hypothetical protein
MKAKEYDIHPLALTYPPMSEPEMEALTADIAERGLQRPIVLYEGKILDGRNRYNGCLRANVEPSFVEYEGDDPLGQVNSLNLNRDLTAGQRAMVAASQWGFGGYSKGGRPGQKPVENSQVSSTRLSQRFRVDRKYITAARDLLAEAKDLAQQVETGALNLADATEELKSRRDHAQQAKNDAAKIAAYDAQFAEAIAEGRMTLEGAIQEIVRREREEKERIRLNIEARELWFTRLEEVRNWAKKWVSGSTDAHLASYWTDELPVTVHRTTVGEIDEIIVQLQRIKSQTPGATSNGRAKGSQKARANPS